jgi:hypothetical protein
MFAVITRTIFGSVTIKPCLIRYRHETNGNAAVRTVALLFHIPPKYYHNGCHNFLTYHQNTFSDPTVRGAGVAATSQVRTSAMLLLLFVGN